MPPRTRKPPGASIHFTVDVSGVRGMQEVLKQLPRSVRNQILQPMVKTLAEAGATAARTHLKRMLPQRPPNQRRWDRPTGVLAASLGAKVVPLSKMRNKDLVVGLYGARTGFRVPVMTRRNVAAIRRRFSGPLGVGKIVHPSGLTNLRSGAIQPTKYIHLVEKGHKAVPAGISKKTGRPYRMIPAARPYPFMAASKASLQASMPTIIAREWHTRFSTVVARMTRRYMKRAGRLVT